MKVNLFPIALFLTFTLAVLKLAGLVNLTWFAVCLPSLFIAGLLVLAMVFSAVMVGLATILVKSGKLKVTVKEKVK